jgi:hypothetical protein
MFSHADILIGIEDQHVIVNCIILIVKFAIYKCRLQNKLPNCFAVVQANIKYVMNIDRYAAVKNNCEDKFLGKWYSVYHDLSKLIYLSWG